MAESAKKEKSFVPFVAVGATVVAASVVGLIGYSLARDASDVKQHLLSRFAEARSDVEPFVTSSKNDEQREAWRAIANSSGESVPWLPQTHGTRASSEWCLNVELEGSGQKLGALVRRRIEGSRTSFDIEGLSLSRGCTCGKDAVVAPERDGSRCGYDR